MGDKIELNPAVYQGILDMTGRGLHLKDASMSGAPGIRGQDQVFNPNAGPDQESALYNLLATKYKLGPKEAEAYTKYYMGGTDPQAKKMREEALEGKRGAFGYPQDGATRTVKGIEEARAAAMLQASQEGMKAAQSERTVGAFVLGGLEKARYGNMTPSTQQVLGMESERSNPYKPMGEPVQPKRTIQVPNGPYGYNYEEEATPQLIPNAPSVPMGPYSPGKLLSPTDPEERQRWLAALPGGSL